MAKAAFIGLGVMGYPMAGHLKTKGGHEVTGLQPHGGEGPQVGR
jgi:3-hydroxyisobutyrate dehydrogenase-like beta-hydroxyacid dehydrogenase